MIKSPHSSVATLTCFKQKSPRHTIFPVRYHRVQVTSSLEIEAWAESPSPNNFTTNTVHPPPSLTGFLPTPVCACHRGRRRNGRRQRPPRRGNTGWRGRSPRRTRRNGNSRAERVFQIKKRKRWKKKKEKKTVATNPFDGMFTLNRGCSAWQELSDHLKILKTWALDYFTVI